MPSSSPRVCTRCGRIHKGRCATGTVKHDTSLSSRRWSRLRQQVIEEQGGLCIVFGCENLVEEVDHILPRVVRPDLMYTRTNLQGMCKMHHALKTHDENGGRHG